MACVILGALAACAHAPAVTAPPRPAASSEPLPWDEAERANVRRELAGVFADPILQSAGLVVLAADGSSLFSRNANRPMVPASSLKVLVAASALDALGPEHRFTTSFVALAPPAADGTLDGPLFVVGGGDPILRSDDLRAGVGALARAGIRRVAGDVVVDATAYAGPEQNATWDPADLGQDYAAGTSAISLDWDVAQFRVTPTSIGAPALVEVVPHNRNVGYSGSLETAGGTEVDIERVAGGGAGHRNEFTVAGHIAAGIPQSFYLPVVGVPWFVGGAVASMLQERSIALGGTVRTGDSPLGGVSLWQHRSPPLSALVRQMLVFSDNHVAEQLLRAIGSSRHAGTDRAGVHVERAWLARSGAGIGGVDVGDGSGLSPHDHIPPGVLAATVAHAIAGKNGPVFLNGLARVGVEGTVRRHTLHAALGRARAKSGHIAEVNALVGTVATRRHGRVAFAFIVNDPRADADAVSLAQDRALDALADF